jgi:hypothetical protein
MLICMARRSRTGSSARYTVRVMIACALKGLALLFLTLLVFFVVLRGWVTEYLLDL